MKLVDRYGWEKESESVLVWRRRIALGIRMITIRTRT